MAHRNFDLPSRRTYGPAAVVLLETWFPSEERFVMKNWVLLSRVLLLATACVAILVSNTFASELIPITFSGSVHSLNGSPAANAVVVSSAGGKAVTDERGEYKLEARLSAKAKSVHISAVGGLGGGLVASQQVSLSTASGAVTVAPMQLATSSGCMPTWLPTFGGAPGVDNAVFAVAAWDDGTGPALYVGGYSETAGGTVANTLAKWDGSNWGPVGSGIEGTEVRALAVYDDGNGEALYAAGTFSHAGGVPAANIAKWDGSDWTALGSGLQNPAPFVFPIVGALAVFDDGNGELLFAGGEFTTAGSVIVNNVAKWNGSSWSSPGIGVNDAVATFTTHDDGNGLALFAGGKFTAAGGAPASHVAKWNGLNWTSLGAGLDDDVFSMTSFDDGGGANLIVGGRFDRSGNVAAVGVAQWDGASWSSMSTGVTASILEVFGVNGLHVIDDGTGPALYAAGFFKIMGGVQADGLAKWDGSNWSALPGEFQNLNLPAKFALGEFDRGTGTQLVVGGRFALAGDAAANSVALWDGSSWSGLGEGLNGYVASMTTFDDGGGTALYVGGKFVDGGGIRRNGVAKWDGSGWSSLGFGVSGGFAEISALEVFDDGNGPALFAGGTFWHASGVSAVGLARWNGVSWTAADTGFAGQVYSLHAFDDGNGSQLYVGGRFTTVPGLTTDHIVRWDGSTWSDLPGVTPNRAASRMIEFDDGSGTALFLAGSFQSLSGAEPIAKWDGNSLVAIPGGFTHPAGVDLGLSVFDDGNGESLYAGGRFLTASGQPANHIAKWDGSNWQEIGGGLDDFVTALFTFDDGRGEALFVAGRFATAGTVAANGIARWDGSAWSTLGGGLDGNTFIFNVFDDGGGEALYVGGQFPGTTAAGDSFLAKWGCQFGLTNNYCNGDGGDGLGCTNCPCGNNASPGTLGGCLNGALSSTRLIAAGDPAVNLSQGSIRDLRFSVTGAPPNVFCLLNSGDALAPMNPMNPCFGLDSGAQALLFDGLRCAVTNTRRHGGRPADLNGEVGVTNSPWGGEGGPPVGIAQMGAGYVAGQTRFFQVIHRDDPLAQCMRGLNTSQAVSVLFTLGS